MRGKAKGHGVPVILMFMMFLLMSVPAIAWVNWDDGCNNCHGRFNPSGGGDLHDFHRTSATNNCDLCHDPANNLFRSDEPAPFNLGCTGCHGRDYGEVSSTDSQPKASAKGLRIQHIARGANCDNCHGTETAVGEDVLPPYYGRGDVVQTDPCNSDGLEDFLSHGNPPGPPDGVGLDNDGNLLKDAADPACGIGSPDFANATKAHDVPIGETRRPGDLVTFTFDICNAGTANAVNFVLTDVLSNICYDLNLFDPTSDLIIDDTDFAPGSVTYNWDLLSSTLTVSVELPEEFPPGDCLPITLILTVGDTPDRSCCNEATIMYDGITTPDQISQVCFDTEIPSEAVIGAIKGLTEINGLPPQVPPPNTAGHRGESLYYTILVANSGAGTGTNLTFHEDWPPCIDASGLTLGDIVITGAAGNVTIDPGTFALDVTGMSINPGSQVTIEINPTSSGNLIVADDAPFAACCNQGTGDYEAIADDPGSVTRYVTSYSPVVFPEEPTCFNVIGGGMNNLGREGANSAE
jgi:hypothetical protein